MPTMDGPKVAVERHDKGTVARFAPSDEMGAPSRLYRPSQNSGKGLGRHVCEMEPATWPVDPPVLRQRGAAQVKGEPK